MGAATGRRRRKDHARATGTRLRGPRAVPRHCLGLTPVRFRLNGGGLTRGRAFKNLQQDDELVRGDIKSLQPVLARAALPHVSLQGAMLGTLQAPREQILERIDSGAIGLRIFTHGKNPNASLPVANGRTTA